MAETTRRGLASLALSAAAILIACAPAAAATYPPDTTLGYGRPPKIPRPG